LDADVREKSEFDVAVIVCDDADIWEGDAVLVLFE